MKAKYRILFFLLGLAGTLILALQTDPSALDWQTAFDPLLLALLLLSLILWLVIYAQHAEVYRLMLGDAAGRMSFVTLMKICCAGLALNNVTPAGLLGGEPYRIMELKRFCSPERAISTTINFSIFYALGHVSLWITGSVIYLLKGCPGGWFATLGMLLVAAGSLALLLLFIRKKGGGYTEPALRLLGRLPLIGRRIDAYREAHTEQLQRIDSSLAAFHGEPVRFRRALALEYLSRLTEGLEYYLILLYLGENAMPWDGVFIASMASLIGNLFFMIPMQAGFREGGTTMAVLWIGIDASAGFLTGLIYRIRDLISTLIGVFCILIESKAKKKAEEKKP